MQRRHPVPKIINQQVKYHGRGTNTLKLNSFLIDLKKNNKYMSLIEIPSEIRRTSKSKQIVISENIQYKKKNELFYKILKVKSSIPSIRQRQISVSKTLF